MSARNTVAKHVFWLTVVAVAFYAGGMAGLLCERFHDSVALSTTVFSVAFASVTAFFGKIWHLISPYFLVDNMR